jgi:hypothetical protein
MAAGASIAAAMVNGVGGCLWWADYSIANIDEFDLAMKQFYVSRR